MIPGKPILAFALGLALALPLAAPAAGVGPVVVAVVVVLGHAPPERFVIGDAHAALARGHGLDRVEGEGADGAEGAEMTTVQPPARGLGGVLEHRDAMPVGNGLDRLDARRRAHHVHRDDRPGFRGDPALQVGRVHVQGQVHLGEHRHGAAVEDGLPGGDKGEPLGDHLVTRAHAERGQGHFERGRARGDRLGVGGAGVGGKGALELGHLPHAVALGGELVAEEHAAVQHLDHLLFFLFPENLETRHDITSLEEQQARSRCAGGGPVQGTPGRPQRVGRGRTKPLSMSRTRSSMWTARASTVRSSTRSTSSRVSLSMKLA